MKTPEIAAELFLSNNTIKWYLKNIYSKLGVHNRADAIERGRRLNLNS
jgi:LuxR family maltose regulon positive regulatory protein